MGLCADAEKGWHERSRQLRQQHHVLKLIQYAEKIRNRQILPESMDPYLREQVQDQLLKEWLAKKGLQVE